MSDSAIETSPTWAAAVADVAQPAANRATMPALATVVTIRRADNTRAAFRVRPTDRSRCYGDQDERSRERARTDTIPQAASGPAHGKTGGHHRGHPFAA